MVKKDDKQGKEAATAPEALPVERPGPRRCKHIKANGKPCRAPPLKDSDFCSAHDPRPEIRRHFKRVSSAGGKASTATAEWASISIKSKEDLRRFVDQVVDQVATGKMPPRVSYALAPHLTLMVKLFEDSPAVPAEDATPAVLEILQDHPDVQAELLERLRPKELSR